MTTAESPPGPGAPDPVASPPAPQPRSPPPAPLQPAPAPAQASPPKALLQQDAKQQPLVHSPITATVTLGSPPLYSIAAAVPNGPPSVQPRPAGSAPAAAGPNPLGPSTPGMPPATALPGMPHMLPNGIELGVQLPLHPAALQQAAAAYAQQLAAAQQVAAAAVAAAGKPPGVAVAVAPPPAGPPMEGVAAGGQVLGPPSEPSGDLSTHPSAGLDESRDGSSSCLLSAKQSLSLSESDRGLAGSSPTAGAASNKALYLGNLHPFVTEEVLQEVFAGLGGITELKVIRDKASNISAGYGFAKFSDHTSAATALARVNKVVLYGQEMRVNWAFQKELKAEAANHVHVFVGDLSSDITDAMLFQAFESLPGCSDARVMWDHATGRSRGYGFVSFRTHEEAEAAIQNMHGHFVGSKRVRCGWAQHKTDNIVQIDPQILDRVDPTNTNVYIGNLAPHLTEANIKRQFNAYGSVAEVKLHRKGAYGFVRYENHEDAVRAIVCMNGQVLGGKQLKCSWGRHPNTPPQAVQSSLMALAAAASVGGALGPGAVSPGGLAPGGMPSPPQALHMGVHMAMPLAGTAAQSIIQGQGGPVGMGLLTPDGDLPSGMHALPMDPAMYPYGVFFGGQQIR